MNVATITGLLRLVDEYSPVLERVAKNVQQSGAKLDQVGKTLSGVGQRLSLGVTAPIVAMSGAVLKSAIDFESSFAGVRKTVNATEAEFAALSSGFREMAKTIPVNVNELNKIGEAAGQLGIKTENILGFTRVMADLGVATNLSSDQAATALARLANITQMPQSEFAQLGSTIVALGNNLATTESEIVEFGLRIAGAGSIAGLTEAQIMAIGAAMSSVGVEAEAGGTAVQKVLISMTEAVQRGGPELQVFAKTAGMTAQQFATAFRDDAGAAFAAFTAGIGQQGIAATATLEKLELTDQRLVKAFLSLGGAGDLLTRSLALGTKAWEENVALAKEAEQRYATTASKLTIFWNRVKDVAITLGDTLLPALTSTLTKAEPLLQWAVQAAAWFASLPEPVQLTAFAVLALVAAVGPALFVLGNLLSMTGLLVQGLGGFIGLAPKAATGFTTIGTAAGTARMAVLGVQGAIAALSVMAIAKFISEAVGLLNDQERWRAEILDNNMRVTNALSIASKIAGRDITDLSEAMRIVNDHNIGARIAAGNSEIVTLSGSVQTATINLQTFGAVGGQAGERLQGVAKAATATAVATADTSARTAALAEALAALRERSTDVIVQAQAWAARTRELGGVTNLTRTQQVALHAALTDVIEEWGSLGKAGLAALRPLREQTDRLVGSVADYREEIARLINLDPQAPLAQLAGSLTILEDRFKPLPARVIDFRTSATTTLPVTRDLTAVLRDLAGVLPSIELSEPVRARDWTLELGQLAQSMERLANISGDSFGGIVKDIASLISALDLAGEAGLQMEAGLAQIGSEGGDAAAGVLQFASGLVTAVAAMEAATQSADKLKNTMNGAATGAQVGGSVGGGWGAAIGAVVGAVWGFAKAQDAQAALRNQERADMAALGTSLLDLAGGYDNLKARIESVGMAYGDVMGVGQDLTAMQRAAAELEERWTRLNAAIDTYGITLGQLGETTKALKVTEAAQILHDDFEALMLAGVASDDIVKAMSGSLNQFITDALTAGAKIPPGMQPIIEQLIQMGLLTDQNARLMLGLAETAGPSFADVKEAAARYGLELDRLGPKIRQLEINETAQQVVDDFNLLISAGANAGAVMAGMADQVQGFVDSALKFGLELPASMQPMLQRMVEAGLLTDENGKKLKDLSGIAFAEPLSAAVDRLIEKLDELIGTLAGDVEKAMAHVTRDRHFKWRGEVETGTADDNGPGPSAPGYAGGTHGQYVDFGRETVVRLHGRERVMTEAEGRREAVGTDRPLVVQTVLPNGQILAETVIENWGAAARSLGVG